MSVHATCDRCGINGPYSLGSGAPKGWGRLSLMDHRYLDLCAPCSEVVSKAIDEVMGDYKLSAAPLETPGATW